MRFRSLKVLAAVVGGSICFATGPFAQNAPATGQAPAAGQAPAGAPAASAEQMPMSDADIIATVLAVDSNEIIAASLAEKKNMTDGAKSFAKKLGKDHKEDAKKYEKLSKKAGMTPSNPQIAIDLRTKGAQEVATLMPLQNADFEKAYLEAMVTGHTEALLLFDSKLIPNAKDKTLKKHLEESRKHITHHLDKANKLMGHQASKTE